MDRALRDVVVKRVMQGTECGEKGLLQRVVQATLARLMCTPQAGLP